MTSISAKNHPVEGVLWMLATGIAFVFVNGIVRYLGTALPAAESAFIRFAWGLLFLAPSLMPLLRSGISPPLFKLFALRGALHTIAVMLWFYAMARITISEVTAIGYLNPIIVTLGAGLFFGEGFRPARMAAIGVAMLGALVVLRPGLRELSPGHLAQLGAAFGFGLSYLVMKRLTQLAPASTVVAVMALSVTIGLAPFALAVWQPVSLTQLLWLGAVAVFATAGHYCMTRAFACAPMTVTQPVTFLQLVWATLLGWSVFGEAVDPWVILGGAIILAAVVFLTWREARGERVKGRI
ncbi:DMT family transporter [Rhodobacter capsulatus]|uniref:EamA domain-containing membrane protein RarD n=1 Tax=Rhodobacter capsulatus TaxID=1061 RepID=A0A1G7IT00_RHOCA|nr:DMT family transporter [Rhodobacter capsulatus]WER10310.1 DMT family transporter [Rhodobacter capsulatus]SDF15797.1 EamA domain-containing membrane protein RarD [Rhodobacter capsulatus]